jgi:site-specific DNA-cytosine methylase
MIDFLRMHPVFLCIFENVPELQKEQFAIPLKNAFHCVDMEVAMDTFESTKYGLPQDRKRTYGVAVNHVVGQMSCEEARQLASKIVKFVIALVVLTV